MSITTRVLSLALAGVILVPVASAAQSTTPITFGVKGGVNSSNVSFNDSADQDDLESLWGAIAGVFVGRRINDNFGLQLEGLFSQKGAKDESSDAKFRLTYIDLPFTLRYGPTTTNGTHFHLFTGPQASFKTKAEQTLEGFPDQDLDDEIESMDFGWTVGAGVEKKRLSLDARYTHGLKDITTSTSDKGKNRTFSLMVGVRLK